MKLFDFQSGDILGTCDRPKQSRAGSSIPPVVPIFRMATLVLQNSDRSQPSILRHRGGQASYIHIALLYLFLMFAAMAISVIRFIELLWRVLIVAYSRGAFEMLRHW